MLGLEKLTGACNLGCKAFWPWQNPEKQPYDVAPVDDDLENASPITTKPVWDDRSVSKPIVKIPRAGRALGVSKENLSGSASLLKEKSNSKDSLSSASGKREIEMVEIVTTV